MKSVFFLLTVLACSSALATTESYPVGPAYVIPTMPGQDVAADAANCPKVIGTEVEIRTGNLDGVSIKLIYDGKAQDELASTGSSRTCYSDVVCPTTDNFASKDGQLSVSLTRNNDGQYPTKDFAGHNALGLLVTTGESTLACYYSLQ